MKELNLIIMVFAFIGCCNPPAILENGLTKNAKKITEYFIKTKFDSINNQLKDTISVEERFYKEDGNIIKTNYNYLRNKQSIEIKFLYNSYNKITQEIATYIEDEKNFIIDYIYKDSLLSQTVAEIKNKESHIIHDSQYKYSSNKKLKENITKMFGINVEYGDTFQNSYEIKTYNNRELLIRTETIDSIYSDMNNKYKFKYKCNGLLKETKVYNLNDSLITLIKFKYIFDKFENWTEKRSYENDTLKRIWIRYIEY